MKKVLFASTALAAVGLMTTGTASAAEKIKLELGGFAKWWVVGAWNDDSYQTAAARDFANVDVKGDVEVKFSGATTLDNGLKVGVEIQLEGGGTTSATTDTIDKSFVWVESGFGKVILGSEDNGTALLHVAAPEAAGLWGAAEGSLTNGQALGQPANVSVQVETVISTDGAAEKITYVAPAFMGLTVGGSYAPRVPEEDNAGVAVATETYGVGALYANEFGGVGVKLSAGWVTYDAAATTANTNEFATGGQLSYAGFTLGGSYKLIKNNYQGDTAAGNAAVQITASTDAKVWDAGLTYASGPYTVGVNYFNSKVDGLIANPSEDEFTVYQASFKYTLGPGIDFAGAIGRGEYDDEGAKAANSDANHNEGWVVMAGLSLEF